jgi:hypothetical protein
MAGRGKLRWVNVDCRHCGHSTVLELKRAHDLERTCSQCGKRGPVLKWIAPEPRQKPEWLRTLAPGKEAEIILLRTDLINVMP